MLNQGLFGYPAPTDHALIAYLAAADKSPAQMARFMLANHILAPRYFHQLRTEQQLGYLVGTGYVPVNTLPGMAFYIQSPVYTAATLYQATVQFFQECINELSSLDNNEFRSLKQGLAAQLYERDTSLSARAKRFWLALGQADYQFDLHQKILYCLEELTASDFLMFLQQLLAADYPVLILATDGAPENNYAQSLHKAELLKILQPQ
jgi:insulysin